MDKKTNTVSEGISEFRTQLLLKMPFFGDLLSHLDIIENSSVDTAATNGRVIYYNQKFFKQLTEGERNFVLMHELMHVILLHVKRKNNKELDFWNVAADYVVNGTLEVLLKKNSYEYWEHGYDFGIPFEKPSCGCFLERYDGQSVEELYRYIYRDNIGNKKRKKYLLLAPGYNKVVKAKLEQVPLNSSDFDIIYELDEKELEQLEGEISRMVENAMKTWSKDPSSKVALRQINILRHERKLPWKKLLKRYLNETELDDSSYDKPERKYLHMDMILPGAAKTTVGGDIDNIWVFIDVSGSISESELDTFVTQLYGICKDFDSKVNIGYWDQSIHEVYLNVSKGQLHECSSEYSGGTDPTCVYEYLEKNKIDPRVLIILTDGYFDPVEKSMIKKYKSKTIVVLSEEPPTDLSDMGKLAKL